MTPGCRKCCGCGKRTSTPTAGPTPAADVSSSRAGAGPPGPAPSAICCRPLRVADLGCGEGYLTIEAARWAKDVVAVDRSDDVLKRGRALARRRRVSNITWKRGELEKLPLADASVDVALLSQALHHAHDPAAALAEAARIVRPGGRVLVLDLRTHDQAWVKAEARRPVAGIR